MKVYNKMFRPDYRFTSTSKPFIIQLLFFFVSHKMQTYFVK